MRAEHGSDWAMKNHRASCCFDNGFGTRSGTRLGTRSRTRLPRQRHQLGRLSANEIKLQEFVTMTCLIGSLISDASISISRSLISLRQQLCGYFLVVRGHASDLFTGYRLCRRPPFREWPCKSRGGCGGGRAENLDFRCFGPWAAPQEPRRAKTICFKPVSSILT